MTVKARRTLKFLMQLTAEEWRLLLAHVDPPDAFDRFPLTASLAGLVSLELTADETDDFLDLVERTANTAQNLEAMDRLGDTHRRLEDGLNGSVDPAAYLLRPAATRAGYTLRQGQYLAFIHWYGKVHGRAPAEADLQAYFRVSPPTIHETLKTLQRRGFIKRKAGVARSIELCLPAGQIPVLE